MDWLFYQTHIHGVYDKFREKTFKLTDCTEYQLSNRHGLIMYFIIPHIIECLFNTVHNTLVRLSFTSIKQYCQIIQVYSTII